MKGGFKIRKIGTRGGFWALDLASLKIVILVHREKS